VTKKNKNMTKQPTVQIVGCFVAFAYFRFYTRKVRSAFKVCTELPLAEVRGVFCKCGIPQVSFVSFTAVRCYNIGIIRHFLFRFYGLRLFLFSSSSTVSDKTVSAF